MTRRGARRTGTGRSSAPPPAGATQQAQPADPQAEARQICLRLLTVRARTRAELATALAKRGIDDDTAEQVLARFSVVGLIDDAAFAESYVHSGHTYRGLGRRALAQQLRRRGVDEETTGEALAAVDSESEEEMARTLVRRRLRGAAPIAGTAEARAAAIRKLVGMLARRGYPEGLAYRVVRDELRAAGQDTTLLDEVADTQLD